MILVSAILILYVVLITFLCVGFLRLKTEKLNPEIQNSTRFSIIVPFRNEAENLNTLLESLSALNYPKSNFEIILVDDASTDDSVALIEAFEQQTDVSISVLENERFSASPKKNALTKGISKAKFEWIITTDADCKVPYLWLKHYNQKITKTQAKFIAGPVSFFEKNTFLNAFQELDFLSLQGATIASFGLIKPFMCNGANLTFSKAEFLILKGYAQTDHLASGDDVFLMQKFIKVIPEQVQYLKTPEALVLTQTQPNWKNLIDQRKRWAAKASAYTSWFAILTSVLVLLGNAALFLIIFFPEIWPFVFLKLVFDFLLIQQTASLFDQKKALIYFPVVAIIYPLFTVYIAFASQFSKFEWKGRAFKK